MKTRKKLFTQINKSLTATLIAGGLCLAFSAETAFAYTLNPSVSAVENRMQDEDFDKKFREGRDLIDKEDWAKAAEKFNEIVGKYPANKSADAALYWLAFCHKKQKQYKETDAALDRLLKDFPASSWVSDAMVMKLEIAAPLGKVFNSSVTLTNSALSPGVFSTANPGKNALSGLYTTTPPETFEKFKALVEMNGAAAQTRLDRADEVKLAAFQSLFSADQKRGIEVMGEVLKSDSKASESLKIEILRAVRRPQILNFPSSAYFSATTTVNSVPNQMIPLLRESLVSSFQNETNVKIRKEIIYTLANLKDEQSINYLARLYASENDREVKKAIIIGFGYFWGTGGVYYSSGIGSLQNSSLPSSAGNVRTQTPEFAKLLEIVRIEKDNELRQLAVGSLQRFAGWEKNVQIVEALIGIYDSEINEDVKKSIINNLGRMKQTQASGKLLDIAKNDKSDKLKLEAIYALRNSNTPEALKYLEELIK